MRLLSHDTDTLKEQFPQAYSFLRAAALREEAFALLCLRHNHNDLSDWQKKRLAELMDCPACNTHHFLSITENMRRKAQTV